MVEPTEDGLVPAPDPLEPAAEPIPRPVAETPDVLDHQKSLPEPAPVAPKAPRTPAAVRARANTGEGGWLPTLNQIIAALQWNLSRAIGPDPGGVPFVRGQHSSMRQGIGLIVLVGLVSGLWRLVLTWVSVAETGALPPLLRASDGLLQIQRWLSWLRPAALPAAQVRELLGGLSAGAPLWFSGGLLSLGAWINTPLRLLALWLVYGLLVLLVAKMLGAPTTLQRFYAATAYAVLPLLLTILQPLTWVGPLLAVVAWLAVMALYAAVVRQITGLEWGRTFICMLAPVAFVGGGMMFLMLLLSLITLM